MQYWKASTLLQVPEDYRQIVYDSGVYMVNDCYLPLYESDSRFIDIFGSRGSGKSHAVTDYVDYILQGEEYCRVALVRLIHGTIRDSLWADFKDRLQSRDATHYYHITDHDMRATCKKTGNKLVAKGVRSDSSQTAKMKSLAGFTHVIIEEADEMPSEEFRKLSLSIRKKGVKTKIIRIFNPPRKSHYIWKDYVLTPSEYEGYFKAESKKDSNILDIFSTYMDNIHNLSDDFVEDLKKNSDNKDGLDDWLRDGLGLIGSGNKGLIYKGWKRISWEEYHNLDYNKYYYIDWGTNDACAIGEVKIHNRIMLVKPLHYMPADELTVGKFLAEKGFTEKDIIVCDSSQPNSIMMLRNGWGVEDLGLFDAEKYPQLLKGFSTIGVRKGSGSILEGINIMRTYDVHIVDGSDGDNAWNEYLEYRWAIDKDGNPTDQPIDKNNHHMDGIRYVAYMLPQLC